MTPEVKVKKAVRAVLDAYAPDLYWFAPPANGYGRVGIPDIIVCYRGQFLAIECKAGRGTTTPMQDRELAAICGARGAALVINERNIDELRQWLEIHK